MAGRSPHSLAFDLLDLFAGNLPGPLNDPGQRALESPRLGDHLGAHSVGDIQVRLALVGLTDGHAGQLTGSPARGSKLRLRA
jgi:hypothetical protein